MWPDAGAAAPDALAGWLRERIAVRAVGPDDAAEPVALDGTRSTAAPFAATLAIESADGPASGLDATLEIECLAPGGADAGVVVALRLPPTAAPRWLIPGLFYGENRPAACRRLFPRYSLDGDDLSAFVSSHWGFRADRAATPAVFGWSGDGGAALATTEQGPLGLNGLGFAGTGPDGPELRLAFPYREEPVAYDGSETPAAPDRPRHRWHAGERVRLPFSAYRLDADPHGYAAVLRDLHARDAVTSELRPWVGIGAAADLAAEGLLRWHYRDRDGGVLYETAAFERQGDGTGDEPGDRAAMHVGWVSGIPHAAAMLRHGRLRSDMSLTAAGERVIDNIVGHPAPCGTLWGQWSATGGWGKGWTPGPNALHGRTIGEAVTFLLRAIRNEAAEGRPRPAWRDAAASNLAYVVARQDDAGGLPSAWDGVTGEVLSRAGAAGLAWVPALVEGGCLLEDAGLLDAARRAGRRYATFVEREFLHGAPEDVDLAPSSEDGYVAVMAYVALLEAEDDADAQAGWLDLACRAADWTLTFRYARNIAFEPDTLLGAYDYRTLGADQASPANQHLHAYGLVCLPEMVRLARHARDAQYLERTRENLACFRQFIARRDGDFNARRGMAPERLYQTACFGPKGAIGPLSHAWSLGLLLYACDEAASIPELADAR
jgi:hypothetical protein